MVKGEFHNEFTYKTYLEQGKEAEFDAHFDKAIEEARRLFGQKHQLYIGGQGVNTGDHLIEKSPIDGTIIGSFAKATREHVRLAIKEAHKAFATWSETDFRTRASHFNKTADVFSKHKFLLSAILSFENGKSRYESVGEVDEAIDFMRYYANELVVNKGFKRVTSQKQSTAKVSAGFQGAPSTKNEKVTITLKPCGVFGIIAPFNFPVSIGVGMSSAAMLTGNTVVFKPSSSDSPTMLTGLKIYEYMKEAGIPDGVFNYLSGPGSEVGDELVVNKGISGIAFTGSRVVGTGMIMKAYNLGLQKTFVVEMGGKNPVIVSKHADLDEAVTGVASAAFGFDGQKCSAASRVYVQDSIKEQFISKLIEKARNFKIGNPLEKGVYMGPLISSNALKTYQEAVEKAKSGGRILYGGHKVNNGMDGNYVEPTIVEVRPDHELVKRELFVPILVVQGYKDFPDALKQANDVDYGLTAGLYSTNSKEIKEFTNAIQAGVVYINRPTSATTGAIVGIHTFVGWKGSSVGGKGTGSKFYLQQFMREQSLSIMK